MAQRKKDKIYSFTEGKKAMHLPFPMSKSPFTQYPIIYISSLHVMHTFKQI